MYRAIRLLAFFGALAGVAGLASHRRDLKADDVYRVASIRIPERGLRAYRPGEVIVQFKDAVRDRDASDMMREAGGRTARRSRFGPRFLVHLDDGFEIADALDRLRTMPGVEFAEPNGVARAFQSAGTFTPHDPFYTSQWHFKMLNSERMWGIQKGDTSVAVAVLDTGIAYEDFGPYRKAPDFGGTVFLPGHDFINDDD